ncbi:uncharacterized protein [Coffea arabica]|uniref:Uncharacterized protein n=1 Tax=Coffea arabica TaxID=13443 RepID=A0ABM4WDC0_COFAR
MAPPPPPPPPPLLPPTKASIPFLLFCLVSISIVFLLFHLTSPTPSITTTSPLPFHNLLPSSPPASSNPPPPHFTLIIKVLTFNRLPSLSRCLTSLSNAHYDNSTTVHLHIFIDHFPLENDKGSQDLDSKLNLSRQILDFVDGFKWDFGEKLVHYRNWNAGLQSQWLEAWWPSSDHEFAFVVEDDLEVSPLYFRYLKALILNYYYNESNFSPMIYGASLQRPRFVPGKHGNKLQADNQSRLFLYQLVGTWGQLLFPKPWKEFRLWYDTHKVKGIKPILDGMVTTGWYKRMGERIWTPWFIKFIHARGYFNIYTNLKNETALAVSHRDAGVNYGKSAGPDSYLVGENTISDLLELQPSSSLKWYDFCFREVIPNRIVKSLEQLGFVLQSIQRLNTIILVNLHGASEPALRNLICHFERLAIGNYIFVGQKSYLSLDLARRGHPVIDVDLILRGTKLYRSLKFQESSKEWIQNIRASASVIKKSLELQYHTWLLDSNIVPLSSNFFFESPDPACDFITGKNLKLLFIKSSSASSRFWVDVFMHKLTVITGSWGSKTSDSMAVNFLSSVEKKLESNGVKYSKIDEMQLGLSINTSDSNLTSLANGKKFAFWSSDTDQERVQKKLVELGLWVVDDELSCTAVVCHQS